MTPARPPGPDRTASPRQVLSERQAATVDALLGAGLDLLHERGFTALSLRDVATRAGVTHTTAYHYFTSKEHLVAEMEWRRLQALPVPEPHPDATVAERLMISVRASTERYLEDPRFAEAVLASLVAGDPDIRRIRDRIGAELLRRMRLALGDAADPTLLDGALLLYSGAMLQAGLGYFTFDEGVDRLGQVIARWSGQPTGP